jgi:hypothetical protein
VLNPPVIKQHTTFIPLNPHLLTVIYIGIRAGDFLLKNKRLPAIPAAGGGLPYTPINLESLSLFPTLQNLRRVSTRWHMFPITSI